MHGGDIYRNDIELDYSVNINPLGIFDECSDIFNDLPSLLGVYPDNNKDELRQVIADTFNISKELIVCANGASELIQAIALYSNAQKALCNSPCFSGYERALLLTGTKIISNNLCPEDDFILGDNIINIIYDNHPDIIFITNPNNPDGNLIGSTLRKEIIKAAISCNALLVVDECFIELTCENEKASFLNDINTSSNMIVIRALTKSYAMPGVRLGYGICSSKKLSDSLNAYLPEWNLSMLSQKIGCRVIGQKEYLDKSRELLKRERAYLSDGLRKLDFTVFKSCANFILFKDDAIKDTGYNESLYDFLLKRKILIRDCSDYKGLEKGYYRIAVKNHMDNELLIKNIKEYRRQ